LTLPPKLILKIPTNGRWKSPIKEFGRVKVYHFQPDIFFIAIQVSFEIFLGFITGKSLLQTTKKSFFAAKNNYNLEP
jgi:hypothetical protein